MIFLFLHSCKNVKDDGLPNMIVIIIIIKTFNTGILLMRYEKNPPLMNMLDKISIGNKEGIILNIKLLIMSLEISIIF